MAIDHLVQCLDRMVIDMNLTTPSTSQYQQQMLGWRVELERSGREGAPRCGAVLMVETKQRRVMDKFGREREHRDIDTDVEQQMQNADTFCSQGRRCCDLQRCVCLCGNSSWKRPWTLT